MALIALEGETPMEIQGRRKSNSQTPIVLHTQAGVFGRGGGRFYTRATYYLFFKSAPISILPSFHIPSNAAIIRDFKINSNACQHHYCNTMAKIIIVPQELVKSKPTRLCCLFYTCFLFLFRFPSIIFSSTCNLAVQKQGQ